MWECEWEDTVNANPPIKTFLRAFSQNLYPPSHERDLELVVASIRDGKFFGFVECDVSVPDELRDKFSEMSPMLKNCELDRSHLSEHMREYAEERGFLPRPQLMLIEACPEKRVSC